MTVKDPFSDEVYNIITDHPSAIPRSPVLIRDEMRSYRLYLHVSDAASDSHHVHHFFQNV